MSARASKVGIYARVSTMDQTTDNQLQDLRRYCQDRGWAVIEEYIDSGVSGTKDKRPALDKLMNAVRKRQVNTVLVWRFDRFARSVTHLVLTLEEFRQLDVAFISFQENIDTGSPLGQAIFTIIAAISELERNIIVERVKAGLRRAKAAGQKLGRPVADADHNIARMLRTEGRSIREIAQQLRIGKSTVARILASKSSQ